MIYQYCNNNHKRIKMNRLYYNNAKVVEGKKQGSKTMLDFYWCQTCKKIYQVETKKQEIKPMEINN